MTKVFFDANVLFAAAYKSTGHARELIFLATQQFLPLTSTFVLESARKNLAELTPNRLEVFDILITDLNPLICPQPTGAEVAKCLNLVKDTSDAPVLAAALKSHCRYLATWNKKDFVGEEIKKRGLSVLTPTELVEILKKVKI